ncbi:MAG: methyltransferase domain-containing protein [Deltaproteobacteria bacterium]|nr:methyltransferase domain-containing protein [Deltaproteobacteria bacterium]
MAVACPVGFDPKRLRDEVSLMYARVAENPRGDFHFHRGAEYAVEWLGYDRLALASLPADVTASFAGVANPHAIGPMAVGATVVDVGSGAGMDLLLAAKRVGPTGRAIGVDMTPAMIERAQGAARRAGLSNVEIRRGDAESLPVESRSVDVVISNGVLNLTTDKIRAFSEIRRVLRPGGALYLGDIIVANELSEGIRNDIDLWSG